MYIVGGNMKFCFSNIMDGSPIILLMHNGSVHSKMHGNIINLIREDIATISLDTPTTQILKFDHMDLDFIYVAEDGTPFIWKKAKVVYFKNNYVLQIKGDGTKYNRRVTYRVTISQIADLRKADDSIHSVLVKDVSLTGFSIVDKKNVLNLSKEDGVTILFTDISHRIDLYGTVIRVEQKDDTVIYGFTIRRSCRDLPSYITTKIGERRSNLPPSYII